MPVPPILCWQVVPYATWLALGLDTAPFTVQSCAPMNLVHFYFSQVSRGSDASPTYID